MSNVNTNFYAPAGVVVHGAIGWDELATTIAFDNIKGQAVLSVGEKDIFPRVVTFTTNADEKNSQWTEYVFGSQKEIVLRLVTYMGGSEVSISFYGKEKEAQCYFQLSRRGDVITEMWGDPTEVIKQFNQKGGSEHEATHSATVATVSY